MPKYYRSGLVTIVVVNWNRRELLRRCLCSLEGQRGVDFEVIVVDNGSTDGSAEMVAAEFGGKAGFPCRLIVNGENRGFCAANNQGIFTGEGEFTALLNNDAEADPGWLAALAKVFEAHPEVGMAASKILVHEDRRRIDKAGHLIYLDGQNRGRGSGELDLGQYDKLEETLWPDGCAAMYRRVMLDEVGGFDEDFFAYGDDAELGLRARIAGWGCLYVPDAVVRHHRASTLGAGSMRRLELIERNRVLLAAKHFPWSLLWLNGGFYLARLIAGLWAAARNKGETSRFPGPRGKLRMAAALLMGDLKACWMLPSAFRKRRRLRRLRKLKSSEILRLLWRYRISLRKLLEESI